MRFLVDESTGPWVAQWLREGSQSAEKSCMIGAGDRPCWQRPVTNMSF